MTIMQHMLYQLTYNSHRELPKEVVRHQRVQPLGKGPAENDTRGAILARSTDTLQMATVESPHGKPVWRDKTHTLIGLGTQATKECKIIWL